MNVRPTAGLGPVFVSGGIFGFWYGPWLLPFLLLLVLALMGLPTLPDSPGGYVLGAGVLVESLLWTLVLSRSYRFVTWEVSSSLATDSATSHHETLAAVPAPQADGPERLER